jgi:hypothetical protein
MSKRATLLLIVILTVSSLVVVEALPALASLPKPAVPEFTVKFEDHSYDVPPTYSTDPYTGKTTMTKAGYRAQNGTIELAIKNQPFTPYDDGNGHFISLYHRIQAKGHFSDSWSYLYPNFNHGYTDYLLASDSDSTVVTVKYGEESNGYPDFGEIPAGGQIDFHVEAFVGYYTIAEAPPGPFWRAYTYLVYTGETSGWSETRTITIPTSTSSPTSSPSPTSTPDQTTEPTPKETLQTLQLGAIIGTVIAVVVVGVGLLFYFKKRKHARINKHSEIEQSST